MLLTSLVVKLVLNVTFTRLILFIFRYIYIIECSSCLDCKNAIRKCYTFAIHGAGPWVLSQDPEARIRKLPVDQSLDHDRQPAEDQAQITRDDYTEDYLFYAEPAHLR